MKPLVVLISILLVASFCLIYAFAQPSKSELPPHMRRDTQTPEKKQERKPTEDANLVMPDANTVTSPNDANAIKVGYKMFEGLEKALERVNQEAEKEIREWMRSRTEDRTNLANTVQEQVVRELNFIRELAVEEGAVKTTAAIDGLLTKRQERVERTIERMEETRRRLREQEERREGRGRDRDRGRRRDREPRRRER